jgi:hypothetical protein
MDHLSAETLARIVDETPRPEEHEHLAACETCTAELDALKAQTEALGALPEILTPVGDWDVLEARLRSEGLLQDPGLFARLGLARTPTWMRAAASVALFLGGAGIGVSVASHGATGPRTPAVPQTAFVADNTTVDNAAIQDAAEELRAAESDYVAALSRYQELRAQQGEDADAGDPRTRYAALQYLVAASQAAVRQAPADPFLNGLLASTLAERQAVLSRISSQSAKKDNWF